MRTLQIYSQPSCVTFSNGTYTFPAVRYIPRTYLCRDWKFVPSDCLCPIPLPSTPPHAPPLGVTDLVSFFCEFVVCFLKFN